VLGLDAREGKVAVSGWQETSAVDAADLAVRFDALPLAAVVYTDIARDGTLAGPNLEATRDLAERLTRPVIASGGVGRIEDIDRLARLPIEGVIVGRALYEGAFTLAEAQKRADRSRTSD
jgi:phosphoribosylformimino-5-aminoimidazole carboxamide ribotide isomerase